ncbi:PepSY domain-containing protein [Emcibacter sp.]|uniref:PepSY domain-containing protein n=1 Tax=Emcibacter sp. TaxID=1979954 RepID=UPI002AA77CD6|nr:PepSY domain-containing protein [Emcibacter sp.]
MTKQLFSFTGLCLVLSLVPISISTAFYAWSAEEERYISHHLSPEQLVRLQQDGDILGLEEIINLVRRNESDRLLEVELLEKNDTLYYKVEILEKSGIVKKYLLDSRTGKPVSCDD